MLDLQVCDLERFSSLLPRGRRRWVYRLLLNVRTCLERSELTSTGQVVPPGCTLRDSCCRHLVQVSVLC